MSLSRDRAALEGVDGVLVAGGDERDLGAWTDLRGCGSFAPAQVQHADIEEGDMALLRGERLQCAAGPRRQRGPAAAATRTQVDGAALGAAALHPR